jgi:hypothetical protein
MYDDDFIIKINDKRLRLTVGLNAVAEGSLQNTRARGDLDLWRKWQQ